jgi:hypothetical protein
VNDRRIKATGVLAVLVIICLLLLIAGVISLAAGWVPRPTLQFREIGAPVCQGVDAEGVVFTSKIRDAKYAAITVSNGGRGIVYRHQANTSSDRNVAGRLVPDTCQVGFEGFCIGEPIPDATGGHIADQQWFILPNGRGYVSGAVVQELPPGTIDKEPQTCEGGRDEPTSILIVAQPKRMPTEQPVTLKFTAPGAAAVGVAYLNRRQQDSEWKSIGVAEESNGQFHVPWKADPTLDSAVVIYTVCWAGNVPGRARGQFQLSTLGQAANQADASPDELAKGASVACHDEAGGS